MPTRNSDQSWIEEVLAFWFEELTPEDWFRKDEAIDAAIVSRFAEAYKRCSQSIPDECGQSARAALAGVIVLDQFPRNMFRNSPKAFTADAQALALAQKAITGGLDEALGVKERQFLYMPFMHSEDRQVQVRSIELFATLGNANTLEFARSHKTIIDRFGRFPHRNTILGRTSTAEEAAFLKEPGSSF